MGVDLNLHPHTHCHISGFESSHTITVSLREKFPTWIITVDTMNTSEYSDTIHASHIVFRSSCHLYLLTPCTPYTSLSALSPYLSYSSKYNSVKFSTFTTRPVNSFFSVSPTSTPSTSPFIRCFATSPETSQIGSVLVIIDITHSLLEPQLHPSSIMFDGWFGTPFLGGENITYVRSPRFKSSFIYVATVYHPFVIFSSRSYLYPYLSVSHSSGVSFLY